MSTMRTLYIRNVPDEVAADLEALAQAEGLSLNALTVRELTHAARRARTAALLADLPRLGIDIDEAIDDLRAARDERDRRRRLARRRSVGRAAGGDRGRDGRGRRCAASHRRRGPAGAADARIPGSGRCRRRSGPPDAWVHLPVRRHDAATLLAGAPGVRCEVRVIRPN